MRKIMHGRILDVDTETRGSELDADAAAGATILVVKDAADFDEDGGWLRVAGQVVEYIAVDDDASTITLKAGLGTAATEDQAVEVWNDLYDEPDTVQYAEVRVDGEDDQSDSIRAAVADGIPELPEGLRGKAGESCTLKRISPDDWEVVAVGGRPTKSKGLNFYEDTLTVTDVGAQTMQLTHEPVDHSEHLYWRPGGLGGVYQGASQFTRNGRLVSIPDAGGHLAAGDKLTVEYSYRRGLRPRSGLDWGASGWRYLQIGQTESKDRSGVNFDDSSWATGDAPFGNYVRSGWLAGATAWPTQTALWLRREYQTNAGHDLTLDLRIDNLADVYWNGENLGHVGAENVVTETSIAVAGSKVKSTNVLAIRAQDDILNVAGNDFTYVDARIRG